MQLFDQNLSKISERLLHGRRLQGGDAVLIVL
jgi:hypothetical protein